MHAIFVRIVLFDVFFLKIFITSTGINWTPFQMERIDQTQSSIIL